MLTFSLTHSLAVSTVLVVLKLCTDLSPLGSSAAGYIHIGFVGQVPANRSCNQKTEKAFNTLGLRMIAAFVTPEFKPEHFESFHVAFVSAGNEILQELLRTFYKIRNENKKKL